MRSIAFAMIWEMLYRGRWSLIAAALGANLLPLLLESTLHRVGGIDPADPSQIVMHVVLVQMNLFLFGAAVISAQGNPARLYAAPIPTSTLVTWHLLPAMVLISLESILSTVALNALFPRLDWPLWGPALFAAVSVVAVNAALWQTEKTAWIPVSLGAVAAVLGLWYKARHGAMFGQPIHYWDQVSAGEAFTLLAVGAIAFYAAIQGVARNRRGDTLRSLGIVDWFNRILDPAADVGTPFRTPAESQFWFVWRQKGWAMPACVVFGMPFGIAIWGLVNRNPDDLMEGLLAGGGILSVVGFLGGLIIGNCGPNDANFEMGNFLATRPMTSRQMSQILLKTMFRSVLSTWCLWAVPFATLYFLLLALGVVVPLKLPEEFGWWCFPASILGLWIVAGLFASLGLTGRNWFSGGVIAGGIAIHFTGLVIAQLTLSSENQAILGLTVSAAWGVLFVVLTVGAYLAARRRILIDSSAIYKAALVWLILSLPVVLTGILRPTFPWPTYLFAVGLMALVVAPISTFPLALAWNRIR